MKYIARLYDSDELGRVRALLHANGIPTVEPLTFARLNHHRDSASRFAFHRRTPGRATRPARLTNGSRRDYSSSWLSRPRSTG